MGFSCRGGIRGSRPRGRGRESGEWGPLEMGHAAFLHCLFSWIDEVPRFLFFFFSLFTFWLAKKSPWRWRSFGGGKRCEEGGKVNPFTGEIFFFFFFCFFFF